MTTNINVKVDFALPELSAAKIATWNFHVDDSAKGRYDMILGRDILTELALNLKFSEHVIELDDGTLTFSTAPMIDMVHFEFKI